MDRRLGIGLAVALGLALLAISYLLGRDSRPAPAAAPVFVTVPGAAPSAVPAGEATASPTAASVDAPPPLPTAVVPAPAAAPAPTAAAEAPPAGPTGDPVRAEVARYFSEVEALQAASKGWSGDPNSAAQQILKETVEGQGGGFDTLVESNKRLLERLRIVQAPAPCAPHLLRTIETVEQANALLSKMREAIRSGSQTTLVSLVAEGQALERRARETDALAATIKKPYGL